MNHRRLSTVLPMTNLADRVTTFDDMREYPKKLCVLMMTAAVLASVAGADGENTPRQEDISFSRDIRPILSGKCFKCHGPDEGARKAKLRLDNRDDAVRSRPNRAVIRPGHPEESEMIARIFSENPDDVMPPPEANKVLTERERTLLKMWIEQGAVYEEHWSFIPPVKINAPNVDRASWPRQTIDSFILARLEAAGLEPSPEADRYTLARRLSLDLIGLPPSPEEAQAFVDDSSPEAYMRLVDRLLDSPRYGERWARRWLDLARYADTNGYEKDRHRDIWPYRDWVIHALNEDMPFDEFTVRQLAGDLLPHPTIEDLIATGFNRNTMLNEEGGIDPLEYRFHAMTDRVATTGTTWLGLTIGCAQCHTHKYDPITHHDYYRFMAFLNNADEPELDIPSPDLEAEFRLRQAEADRLLDTMADHWPLKESSAGSGIEDELSPEARRQEAVEAAFQNWLRQERERAVRWTPVAPREVTSNLPHLTVQQDSSVFASGDTSKQDTYRLAFPLPEGNITAIRLEALPDDRLPAHGPGMTYYEGEKGDFFLVDFSLAAQDGPVRIQKASHSYAKNRFGDHEVSAQLALDNDLQTGWSVSGRTGERHVAVFNLEHPLPGDQEIQLKMVFGRHFASSLGRFRISVTRDAKPAEARDLPVATESLLLLSDTELTTEQRSQLRETFLLNAPELTEHARTIRKLRQPPNYDTTLIMRERPSQNPRPTYIHPRGEFLQRREEVNPGIPQFLTSRNHPAASNRLEFARWLVSSENPLTARVTVNRQWAAFFGQGLVKTVEDFGMQGELPSHPDLLDWLAVDFMEQSWSLKKLHRQIVLSATYRQSSRVSPAQLRQDPHNRLLSRGPRFRMEAEILRDQILKASGLLTEKMFGAPVRPPQPEGVTEVAYGNPKWNTSEGADRYRRSIYAYQKRSAPFAMFSTFDAPSGEACVARRDVSNSSLQALTLLNDVMLVEAAQALGRLVAAHSADDHDRVRLAFRRVLVRPPTTDEVDTLTEFVQRQRSRFQSGELDANVVAGVESEGSDALEHATWTSLARALFNLDETVTKG